MRLTKMSCMLYCRVELQNQVYLCLSLNSNNLSYHIYSLLLAFTFKWMEDTCQYLSAFFKLQPLGMLCSISSLTISCLLKEERFYQIHKIIQLRFYHGQSLVLHPLTREVAWVSLWICKATGISEISIFLVYYLVNRVLLVCLFLSGTTTCWAQVYS